MYMYVTMHMDACVHEIEMLIHLYVDEGKEVLM